MCLPGSTSARFVVVMQGGGGVDGHGLPPAEKSQRPTGVLLMRVLVELPIVSRTGALVMELLWFET